MSDVGEIKRELSRALVWFRDDLRVHDNEALHLAAANHHELIMFFCFDERFFGKTQFGFEKTGPFRAQFLIESVRSLKEQLISLGSDLVICTGRSEENLKRICKDYKIDKLYANKSIHSEENRIQESVEASVSCPIHYVYGSSLIHPNDLPFKPRETSSSFSQFRKKVEANLIIRKEFPRPVNIPKLPNEVITGSIPNMVSLGLNTNSSDLTKILAKGGEEEGLKRLKHYFFDSQHILQYKETRNGLIGLDYSSKFSLWLWNGALSPRKIYWELKRFESEVKANSSTYWLLFELLWRDFYKFTAMKEGNKIFKKEGIQDRELTWNSNELLFDAWAKGQTGIPFVDANMRELNQTGFMSNRGRQNVASFFVKELGLDWRMGASYFESKLIDYDVASNYGNWMYIAGVGNDSKDRYFNIILQAKRYDPEGAYVKHWIPDLSDCSSRMVHHPWTSTKDLFHTPELNYPDPIMEPDYWKKHY